MRVLPGSPPIKSTRRLVHPAKRHRTKAGTGNNHRFTAESSSERLASGGVVSFQMEGLIPFLYKAIKERRSRSYSRCSSAGSAHHGRFAARARAEDGAWGEQKQWEAAGAEREMAHRRHRSLEELAAEVGASPDWRSLQRGRGGSARIFACIGGM